jgi:ubiquinone/menaquinone biosynthesis C-methylase UbiE
LPFKDKQFDLTLCIDVLEHLPKYTGIKLIKEMQRISKMIIIITPNWKCPQGEINGNPFQRHISKWSPNELKKLGFKVRGVRNKLNFPYIGLILDGLAYIFPEISR